MTLDAFYLTHSRITRSLKKFISEQEKALDLEVFESFLGSLNEILKSAKLELRSVPAGPLRARKLHQMVNEEIDREKEIESSCRKGCSACCYIEVEITSYELEILESLVRNGHPIDHQRLALQAVREVADPLWKKGSHLAQNKCFFLNPVGDCSIYEDRPVMCRRHSVTSPATLCATLDAPIVIRYFPKVDVIISADNEDPTLQIGPLAKMLSQRLS